MCDLSIGTSLYWLLNEKVDKTSNFKPCSVLYSWNVSKNEPFSIIVYSPLIIDLKQQFSTISLELAYSEAPEILQRAQKS